MQAIPDASSRVNLDLETADRARTIARSTRAGAVRARHDGDVLQSPGGLPFCLVVDERAHHADRSDPSAVLDQICIDIPPSDWDEELSFWHTMTGRQLEWGLRTEFPS
jgi:hypothetical protein